MSLTRINQNISSINAQRNLDINSDRIGRSIERLSSGLRINRGADDPAGLVISELLRAQVSGLDVAEQNASQGVNLIKTAEGALNEVSGLLRQMRDLAVDAASDSNKNVDARAALQSQVESALNTIDEIAVNTKYAGRSLLDGSAGASREILDSTIVAEQNLSSVEANGNVGVQVLTAAEKAVSESGTGGAVVAGNTVHGTGSIDLSTGGDALNLAINGHNVKATAAMGGGDLAIDNAVTWQQVVDSINETEALDGLVTARITAGGELAIESVEYGSDANVSVQYSGTATDSTDILENGAATMFEADAGVDVEAEVAFGGNAFDSGHDVAFDGDGLEISHATYGSISLTEAAATTVADNADVINAQDGQLSFQIGFMAGDTAGTTISSMRTTDLGTTAALSTIDISTVAGAEDALAVVDEAINQVSAVRGDLGAFQVNELEAEARSLAVARENLSASESQIRDTDFGREMAEFTTSQVLVQSATSFLSQANSLPQNVLQLIQA
jgi:flagellin